MGKPGKRRLDVVELRQFCLVMGIAPDRFMRRLDDNLVRDWVREAGAFWEALTHS